MTKLIVAMRFFRIFKLFFLILPRIRNKEIYFFFPSIHLGGAETVHGDIISNFIKYKTTCLITSFSANNFNENRFKKVTELHNLYSVLKVPRLYKIAIKMIAKTINKSNNPIIFSSNSYFFYDLLPYLKPHVKTIDLIHAFSYEQETALEKYSLNRIKLIDKRVVLGNKTKSDFGKLYEENNINLSYLNKICIIRNKIDFPNFDINQKQTKTFNVLFVGRDSAEKRPELFFKIAKKCLDANLDVKFQMIGDCFSNFEKLDNLTIVGAIKDKKELNTYYKNGNIILITSTREGFPMVLLESMVYGVIPISTDVGEINEVINPSQNNGFLINIDNSEEKLVNDFYDKICLLMNDKDLYNEFRKNSVSTILDNFSEETNKQNYLNLFFN